MDRINMAQVVRRRRGVMYLEGTPTYIFDHIMSDDGSSPDYVACFNVDVALYEHSKGDRIEKATVELKRTAYNQNTVLGRLSEAIRKNKSVPKSTHVIIPATYISVVTTGVGSLSGKRGQGFYEYLKDEVDLISGKLITGDRTGVFVLLDDIYWDEPVIDLETLQRSLSDAGNDWHDL